MSRAQRAAYYGQESASGYCEKLFMLASFLAGFGPCQPFRDIVEHLRAS